MGTDIYFYAIAAHTVIVKTQFHIAGIVGHLVTEPHNKKPNRSFHWQRAEMFDG